MFKAIIPFQEVELPSNGLLGTPKVVKVRAMTGKEEMHLMSSGLSNAIDKIVSACTTDENGNDIDIDKLCTPDKLYLILMIRSVTYGDTIKVNYTCPHCESKQTGNINISELPVTKLTKDMIDNMSFTLPDSKIDVTIKILPESVLAKIEDESKKISAKIGSNPKEYAYLLRMIKHIELLTYQDEEKGKINVNDDPKNRTTLQYILENITGKDISMLRLHIEQCMDFGIELSQISKCTNCEEENELSVSLMNTEFFRPTNIGSTE